MCKKLVLEKHYSFELVSKQKGPNESNIRKWVIIKYGKIGFYQENIKAIRLILR
jgi:hypothetical protein